jgi:quercetin 2,3-dioxygenase
MIEVVKTKDRHYRDMGWLQTYWHFSFDDYYDPANSSWSVLRVFNDDVFRPGQGFGAHPHRDMEIVTYVLDGELEHQDNRGNRGVVRPGEIQVMSAGTGIVHSEYNHSKEYPVRLLQLWILPRRKGLPPRWEQRRFSVENRSGKFLPVVSGGDVPETLTIDQDAQIYVAALRAGQELLHKSRTGRKAYLFVISGSLTVNGTPLEVGDQARIAHEPEISIQAEADAELIFLDLP